MSTLDELLSRMVSQHQSSLSLVDAVVISMRDDGINLTYQGQLVSDAAVLSSYNGSPGDIVACLVVSTRWLVLGKIGVTEDIPIETTDISWSDTPPTGSGWQKSASGDVYVQDGRIHVVRESTSTDPVKPPKEDKTFNPTGTQTYASKRKNPYFGSVVAQGAWGGRAPNTGIWVYGSQLSDFAKGRSLTRLTMEVSREDDGSGVFGPATMHLGLIENGSIPSSTPSLSHTWTPGAKLSPGDALRGKNAITIPDAQRDLLASGQYKGIGCYTRVQRDYIVYGNCGKLHAWAQ